MTEIKANTLIETICRLSVSEQRVLAFLVARMRSTDKESKRYRIKASKLYGLIENNPNKNELQQLQDLCRGLLQRTLKIKTRKGWLMVNWLMSVEYFMGREMLEFEFSGKLKPYMMQIKKRLTSPKGTELIKFKSRYSVKMHAFMKQYGSVGVHIFKLADLREKLGIEKTKYPKWKDFRVHVLEPALYELPKKTPIRFSYTAHQEGRAIGWVTFRIRRPLQKSTTSSVSEA